MRNNITWKNKQSQEKKTIILIPSSGSRPVTSVIRGENMFLSDATRPLN